MDAVLISILEIIKFTLPALIVFLTAYYVLKKYLENETRHKMIDQKTRVKKETVRLRLQAYERLVLFLERISVPNLLMRVAPGKRTTEELKHALLAAIQQEYEHNLSQQVYVSENLWTIVQLARQDTANMISNVADTLPGSATKEDFVHVLLETEGKRKDKPLQKARSAVRQEAALQL